MKISSLEIQNLYNLYDYNVSFNNDLTFLYGKNGCGKTTILNILESVVSGRLYDLFSWNFSKIDLKYYDDTNPKRKKKQSCVSISLNGNDLCIKAREKSDTICRDDYARIREDSDSYEELFSAMSKRFPVLFEIKEEFNYVYLPLNRNAPSTGDIPFYRRRPIRHRIYPNEFENSGSFSEEEIAKGMDLVRRKYAEAAAQIRTINDKFRNEVLKSLLTDQASISDDEDFFRFLNATSVMEDLDEIKGKYFKLLRSLELFDEIPINKFNALFEECKKGIDLLKSKRGGPLSMSFIYNCHTIVKMKTLIELAEEMEKTKSEAFRRIRLFVDTMNSFVMADDGDKRVDVDETGRVRFFANNGDTNVLPFQLSSGEKQLFVFFANLVFNVEEDKSSIFIVDEPELSLHLSWQKMFVEKAIMVNPNMQLIFATHAPEIVFNRRDKMIKLEKIQHQPSEGVAYGE